MLECKWTSSFNGTYLPQVVISINHPPGTKQNDWKQAPICCQTSIITTPMQELDPATRFYEIHIKKVKTDRPYLKN